MSDDYFKIAHYAISVLAALGTFLLYLLRGKFVTREEHESLSAAVADKAKQSELDAHRVETNKRFDQGSAKMAELAQLIGRVDQALRNLPTKEDLHQLALALKEVGGDMKAIRTEARANEKDVVELRATVIRHEEIMAHASAAAIQAGRAK
ncbi:MAG: DUF2730 domain-containing protein [Tagaea sp.]|nr:DUF2730 domain-containing protein [Tagaea sp.]